MTDGSLTWNTLPLAGGGRALIEASAGTGKTWTIAALYLRLHLEQGLLPPQIVVTTFTNAAAQELRERLRARLLEALARADAPRGEAAPEAATDGDEVEQWLDDRWRVDPSLRAADARSLRLALAEFDRAPITTLHGLCGKIIAEHGLATGADFSASTMSSGKGLDAQLRDDAWRRIVQSPPAQRSAGERAWADAGYKKFGEALAKSCEPGVDVLPIPSDVTAVAEVMQAKNAQPIRDWYAQHGASWLKANSKWHRNLPMLASFIELGDPVAASCPDFDALAQDLTTPFLKAHLDAASKDRVVAFVRHAAAVLANVAVAERAQTLASTRQWLLSERERRLRARAELSFDAMIARVAAALAGDGGEELAANVCRRWPIALVDEFQDTDARQFAILDCLWPWPCPVAVDTKANTDTRPPQLLMIGDPKQAIYGFRGGDIVAYQHAGASAQSHMRLEVNRRSTPAYVAACNELFADPDSALGRIGKDAIHYVPATARAAKDGDKILTVDGLPCARPLSIHVRPGDGENVNADELREQALKACADHVALLLQERRHRIGGELLAPGDLAVLLPKNQDVAELRKRLTARGVPSVGAGSQSVFAGDSARDLQVILYAIAHPHEATAVRAALATPLFFDRDFAALRSRGEDAAAWQQTTLQFVHWQRRWQHGGVQAALADLIASQAEHLGGHAESERRLTDLRHLGELLQARAARGDGPQDLLDWLAEQRRGDGDDDDVDAGEERQLRIESDARRVRLMTLHACKGLQFPMVLLPLLWAHKGRKVALPLARVGKGGNRLLDLGGPLYETAVETAKWEDQDERFRVLYVALTRAQYGCHVYALDQDVAKDEHERSALQVQLSRLRARIGKQPFATACPHIDWSQGWQWASSNYVPDGIAPPAARAARTLALASRPFAGRYSFSSLTRRHDEAAEAGGASDEPLVESLTTAASDDGASAHPQLAALENWKGPEFGTALHSVLERHAIGMPLTAQRELAQRCLRENGIDFVHEPDLPARVVARLQSVLDADLRLADGARLRLRDLPRQRQRHELAFRFALDGTRMQRLRAICMAHGEPDLLPAQAPPRLRGTMSGFIDLVFEHEGRFHVLDWKSNWLGVHLDDYAPDAVRAAMDQHHYRFQALLYTIALDRYLRSRLHDYDRSRQLGAAVYLFVRAVGLERDAGVWTQRFSDALVADADAVLAQTDIEVAA